MQNINNFNTEEELIKSVAQLIVKNAAEQIAFKNKFTIALSGGNTPIALFKLLASPSFAAQINWKRVFIFWVDERCVPLDDTENNAYNAYLHLLNHVPLPKQNIFRIPVEETPINAAIYYEATIKIFFKSDIPSFDMILLGMGDDGHTASLFPNSALLNDEKKLVSEVFVANKNSWRVTLMPSCINNAKHKIFLVNGTQKKQMLKKVLHTEKNISLYPAQLITNAIWFVCV
jgi:6-phosphogluconolactonase